MDVLKHGIGTNGNKCICAILLRCSISELALSWEHALNFLCYIMDIVKYFCTV